MRRSSPDWVLVVSVCGHPTVARDGTSDRQRRGAYAGRGRGGLRFDRWRGSSIAQAAPTASPQRCCSAGTSAGGSLQTGSGIRRSTPIRCDRLVPRSATGVLGVAPATTCGISETDRVLTFFAGQSAGQCGPCHVGLPAVADTFHKVATGRARPLRSTCSCVGRTTSRGRGACRHPDGAMLFLASAMDVFAADLRHHLRHGACRFSGQPASLPVPPTEAGWW